MTAAAIWLLGFTCVYGSSTEQALGNTVSRTGAQVMIYRISTSEVSTINWPADTNVAWPIGSIIKIYSVLTRFENGAPDPVERHSCRGHNRTMPVVERCWLRDGHGELDLPRAIAFSCNSYFYQYVQSLDFEQFMQTLRREGIYSGNANQGQAVMTRENQLEAMTGRLNFIRVRPLELLKSLARLKEKPADTRTPILDGMNLSYRTGTASKSRMALAMSEELPVYCKTGTGIQEDSDGRIERWKTSGVFAALMGDYAVFVRVEHSTGAEEPSRIGLLILKQLATESIRKSKPAEL